MAVVEKIVCQGDQYSIALVLDDVAKTLTGIHGVNTNSKPLNVILTVQGVDRSRVLGVGADVQIVLPVARPYTEPLLRNGTTGIRIAGLDGIGVSST